ncbi:SDR family oxidoreductase [Pseudonocardiaceae bacterium YIM PH 21723]|nr:SDR family oxidoreductase [Pseudonocardiaceae bacterium YIM PH 21723]
MSLPPPTPRNRAVITGASSGIGEALAEQFAAKGYSLILVARREDRLAALADRLAEQYKVTAEIRVCDLADPAARLILAAELSTLDVAILANNAGYATYGDLSTLDRTRELRQVELNATAVHHLTLAVLPGMLERKAGTILITGSTAGNQPGPGNTTYAATKAFANTFAESLHSELSGTGVGCTLLAPGPVRTEFAEAAEVSNLDKLVPGPLWVSAEDAARQAIDGLERNKRRVVPGPFAKAQTLGGLYGPRGVAGPLLRRVYRKVK